MRAVWSYWSKPYPSHRHWCSDFYSNLSWWLSVHQASIHYPDTWLFTDDDGAKRLVDTLGLQFAHVRTDLNNLSEYDPELWALGKIYTYGRQGYPFVHIDHDVFLWEPLPEKLLRAQLLAQNPEPFLENAFYEPEVIEEVLNAVGGWIPKEWKWYRTSGRWLHGECCGIYGGNDTDFIWYMSQLALRMVTNPLNLDALRKLENKTRFVVLLEQFIPAACIDYYGGKIEYLYNDIYKSTWNGGYTHLMGEHKKSAKSLRILENKVKELSPETYEKYRLM